MGNKNAKSSASNSAAKALVEDAIATHPVVIFSKSYCPYCHSAKSDIRQAGASVANFAPPKIFELDNMGSQGLTIQAYLAQLTGRRTVPNVFIGGRPVGGGDEIAGFSRRNVLKQMLTQAPDRLAANNPGRRGGGQPQEGPQEEPQEPQEDVKGPKELVEQAIAQYPVVIFSKSWCPYCHSAKANIAKVASQVEGFQGAKIFELDQMEAVGESVQSYLMQTTGRRTVPNVFIGGVTVGGGDDVAALAARGELHTLITDAVKGNSASHVPAASSEDPAQRLVEEAVTEHPVVVFSKSWCPYCKAVKGTLAKVGAEVTGYEAPKVFELDTMGTLGEDVQRYLTEKTGQRTVPNVFIGGKQVGGNDDVSGLAASGELQPMLASAVGSTTAVSVDKSAPATKEIVFGAGCFWGVELAFQRVSGVVETEVGYTNGRIPRVTYDAVCTGLTGSAEVVRVTYDPAVVSLAELLKVWESRHDPTSLNKQGNDVGTQYRSGVYYNDEEQAAEIAEWKKDADSRLSKGVVSEIAPVKNYCTAEDYHQRYLEKKGQSAAKGASAHIRCYG